MASAQIQSARLVDLLLSPEIQVQLPQESEEVPANLSAAEVAKVFTDHVPGVRTFLFRQQRGQYVLRFLQTAYKDGWSAFQGTPLQDHLKWLMRLIVHYGHEGKSGAASYLTEVAEAFMDCQAVQARVVERVGLQIRGVTTNFHGLVVALVGEYKTMALKMLAAERIAQGKAHDDATPTHYENRLTADLGHALGLNAADVRRASLDQHASARFARLRHHDVEAAVARARELFDMQALVQALVSKLNSFSDASAPDSLPRLFLDWASDSLTEKHIVFDEETCSRVDVDCVFGMASLEKLFLGHLEVSSDTTYRGAKLSELFNSEGSANIKEEAVAQCNYVSVEGKQDCDCEVQLFNTEGTATINVEGEAQGNYVSGEGEEDCDCEVQYYSNDKSNTTDDKLVRVSNTTDGKLVSLLDLLAIYSPLRLAKKVGNLLEALLPTTGNVSVAED